MTLAMDLGVAAEEGVHIAPRREFNPFAPLRPNTLYCYGVDFLSTKDVLAAFGDYAPQNIEWIDDSSCNVVFEGTEVPGRVLQELASGIRETEEPWTVTRPLSAGGNAAPQKPRRAALREFQLEMRIATEADRKEVGHSGHTDSVYYAHNKEQQALEKQRLEAQSLKKRQRRSRFPARREPEVSANAAAVPETSRSETAASAPNSGGDVVVAPPDAVAAESAAPPSAPPRLGRRGLLDPLLFLRAPGAGNSSSEVGQTGEVSDSSKGNLLEMLQKSEAEYTAITLPQTELQRQNAAADMKARDLRGRQPQRGRAKGTGKGKDTFPRPGRDRSPRGDAQESKQQHTRGKKRRPVSQEPRPVSSIAPPPRKVQAYPQVEEFLKESNLRCQKFTLQQSFQRIKFGQSNKKPQAKLAGQDSSAAAADAPQPEKKLPPWEEYFRANSNFIRQGQFMHTVAFMAEGRRLLAVVPHPKRVSMAHLARAAQVPEQVIKQRKLKDIEKETGFPTFVCPPFGHPKDSQGRPPLLLVDSSITELKRPLLFDCGFVGLSVMPQEFVSIARASCVEGLAKDEEVKPAASTSVTAGSEMQSSVMPQCGPPQILGPEVGSKPAEVQQPAATPSSRNDATMGS
jgi:prolyl-tRNA editing enzyme YbaK/EbsC (Cys-tRNA(Pro) deacylase)